MRRETMPGFLLVLVLTVALLALVPILHLPKGFALVTLFPGLWMLFVMASAMGARTDHRRGGLP